MIQSRQIDAFRAVMRTGGMTSAAEALHVTQPAVSRMIKDLEQELGLRLFNRRGNLVTPTPEARLLAEEVERSFLGLTRISSFADDVRRGQAGTVRVACLPAMASGFFPRFVAGFCRNRPALNVLIDSLPSRLIWERIANGQIEIGITAVAFEYSSLGMIMLNDAAVIVMPEGHHLASRRVVHAPDLEGEGVILLSTGSYGRHAIETALRPVQFRRAIETPQATIACVMVAEGMGLAIVDPFSASEFVGRGLVAREFEPTLSIGSAICISNDRPLSLVASEFRAAFLDHVKGFLSKAPYLSP